MRDHVFIIYLLQTEAYIKLPISELHATTKYRIKDKEVPWN